MSDDGDCCFPVTGYTKPAVGEMEARKDAAYLERNQVVAALAKCFPSGIAKTAIEGWSEDWHGCVYIDLPTGQVSWHYHDSQAYLFDGLPAYAKPWDGHSTEEKYQRVAALMPQKAYAQGRREGLEESATVVEGMYLKPEHIWDADTLDGAINAIRAKAKEAGHE